MAQVRNRLNQNSLRVCRKPLSAADIRVAARDGAKVQELAAFAYRDGQRLVHVHPADRVSHQAPRSSGRLRRSRDILPPLRHGSSILQHPAEDVAKQPNAPRYNQHPKQKPHSPSKKCHGSQNQALKQWNPPCPTQASVCKGKRGSQTKRRNFNGLRAASRCRMLPSQRLISM